MKHGDVVLITSTGARIAPKELEFDQYGALVIPFKMTVDIVALEIFGERQEESGGFSGPRRLFADDALMIRGVLGYEKSVKI